MVSDFHEKQFDESTTLKLAVFRGYIREWIPVFLTQTPKGSARKRNVNILDFFSGPGQDASGNPGSPMIILGEMKKYCEERKDLRDKHVSINIVFNDIDKDNITRLKCLAEREACKAGCCTIKYSADHFDNALASYLDLMKRTDSANLVILDPFGVKNITLEVVRKLAEIPTTDLMIFSPSSFIKRFAEDPALRAHLAIAEEDLKQTEYKKIHRLICQYLRQAVHPSYFVAPFSIKKGANIYGIIFGSNSLKGLEKFLKVCWTLDPCTGESNYDIDDDPIRVSNQLWLDPAENNPKKMNSFDNELREFLAEHERDNREVYRFVLEKGFVPKLAAEILDRWQKDGSLRVASIVPAKTVRKGCYYLSYDHYKADSPRVRFHI
jgi:three-Cys-motif partner protein